MRLSQIESNQKSLGKIVVENLHQGKNKCLLNKKTSSLSLLELSKNNMTSAQGTRKLFISMLGSTLAFAFLIGLTIASVVNENADSDSQKSIAVDEEMLLEHDNENLSLVKRTALPEPHRSIPQPQRFRPRQRQLNNFGSGLKSSFSLAEIVNNEYSAERWNGTWISDTEFAYRNRQGDLAILRLVFLNWIFSYISIRKEYYSQLIILSFQYC